MFYLLPYLLIFYFKIRIVFRNVFVIWSYTLTEESRLSLPENRLLRKMFGSKRENEREAGKNRLLRNGVVLLLAK
jgi:hypothetical protein